LKPHKKILHNELFLQVIQFWENPIKGLLMQKKSKGANIKIDFNLLMSGTWVLEKKGKQTIHKFEKELKEGKVIIYNALDVPSILDSKVLDYLMVKSQEQGWPKELLIGSLRQIAKNLSITPNNKQINRIKKAFEILVNTRIRFEDCFLDTGVLEHFEGKIKVVNIGILSDYAFIPMKGRGNPLAVKVIFNDNFLALCKYSLGYKLIPYGPINGLRDTAYALYKWAWRWFNSKKGHGERWIGNGQSLVQWYKNELNSTGNYKYPSEVLRRVKSAIKQLNENKEVPFYLQLKQKDGNYKIEIYRKDKYILKREIPFDKLPNFLRKAVIKLIERKKYIREPYALARSMSWRELEDLLKKLVVITVPKRIWEFIELSIREMQNEREKLELTQSIFSYENLESNEVSIVVEKTNLKKNNALYKLLDFLIPNWRIFIQDAVEYTKENKLLTK